MRKALLGALAAGLLAAMNATTTAQQGPLTGPPPSNEPCKMKKIEDGVWCETCNKVLDDVDNHSKGEVTKDHKTEKIQVCVVKYFHCEKCHTPSMSDGKCHGERRKELVDRSRIRLRCDDCGTVAEKAGICQAAACRGKKHKVRLVCDKNKNFPHGPTSTYK